MTMSSFDPAAARLGRIKNSALGMAKSLIESNLVTQDPDLQPLCTRLVRFRPLLDKAGSTDNALQFMSQGMGMVSFKPNPAAPDKQEAVRLLGLLVDKLASMASMFGLK